MKKVLLATTALGMLISASAFAEGPTVTIGGTSNGQVGWGFNKSEYRAGDTTYSTNAHTRHDTKIDFKIDGKGDNGLNYGALVELQADTSGSDSYDSSTGANANRSFIFVDSGVGRVELGSNNGSADSLRVDASTFARATGGIGGDWWRYANLTGLDTAYVLPGLPSAVFPSDILAPSGAVGATSNYKDRATANKISYYTPRIEGFQAGVSYTPDQAEKGTQASWASPQNVTGNPAAFTNVWDGGLNYQNEFNGVGIKASATGETGTQKDNINNSRTSRDDLRAYALGLSASYAGATLGGSYGNASQFGQAKVANSDATYWNLGAAYETGPVGLSLGYFNSEVKHADQSAGSPKNSLKDWSFGTDYKLAPGLVPYAEVTWFDTNDHDASTTDNSGTVLLVGTQVNF